MNYLAQIDSGSLQQLESSIGLEFAGGTLGDIVGKFLQYVFPIAGLILLIYLLIGGYKLMFSAGNPKAVQAAKGIITNAFIGFIIVFLAFWIVQLIGIILGIESITNTF